MLTDLISSLGNLNKGLDSDFADRLNFRHTSLILISLGILVTTRQFVGDAIICWSPQMFTGQWINYADAYCWFYGTYNHGHEPLATHNPTGATLLLYYQWTPLVLFVMALLFTIPHLVWKAIYDNAGVNFEDITMMATSFDTMVDVEQWQNVIAKISRHIDRYLELQKHPDPTICNKIRSFLTGRCIIDISRHNGNYLTTTYPVVKCLFLLNIMLQYYCLTCWMGEDYLLYGFTVIVQVIYYGRPFAHVIEMFPRVTWCSMNARVVEEVHTHHMPCVLPINIFNEYVFLFIWYWLLFIFLVTSITLLMWCASCTRVGGYDYIRKHLKFSGRLNSTVEKKYMKRFLRGYLKSDGLFIIKMLSKNTSSVFISDLILNLFDLYIRKSKGPTSNSYIDEKGSVLDQNFDFPPAHHLNGGDRSSPPALPPKSLRLRQEMTIGGRHYIPVPPPPQNEYPDITSSGLTLGRGSDEGTLQAAPAQRRLLTTASPDGNYDEKEKKYNEFAMGQSVPGIAEQQMQMQTDSLMNVMPPNYSMQLEK